VTLPTEAVTQAGSGLVFINSYSSNITSAIQAQFRSAALAAEHYLQSQFTNSLTISVDFDFASLGQSASAENSFETINTTYSALVAALNAHAVTSDQKTAVAGLPAADPSNGAGWELPESQAVMLGLAPQTNDVNLTVTLNSDLTWNFTQDAIGAIEHEISEGGFGRVGSLGLQATRWEPMDLYRFTAAGQRDYTGGQDGVPTYFGIDGNHVTSLQYHSSISAAGVDDNQDLADWTGTRGDAFGPGGPNAPGTVSATDLQVLTALGWTPMSQGAWVPAADDLASSVNDTSHPFGALSAAGVATGTLQQAGDRDLFKVQLFAGVTYTVSETGHVGGGGTLADPYLRLDDATGNAVAQNDDIVDGTNPDSRLTFTPTTSGTYYVEAGAYSDGYQGSYTVSVADGLTLSAALTGSLAAVLRVQPNYLPDANVVSALAATGVTAAQAATQLVAAAQTTSSVATMSYEFFTGSVPSSGGMDFLVSPTGPNASNINSAYYQSFNIENRYINFAVNLGKLGAGATAFNAAYGALDLFHATQQAYGVIFGITPSDTKVHALLDPTVTLGGTTMTRADYFAYYGGDGANGIGTKAAMVGWLLAEAVLADVGNYAKSNDAFLTDVSTNGAAYGVDIIGHYNQPSFAFNGG
jgi:hypothetical protein